MWSAPKRCSKKRKGESMVSIRRFCVVVIMLIVNCGLLRADIIKLKDGLQVEGKIIAETEDLIMIRIDGKARKIYRKDIQAIIKSKAPKPGERGKTRVPDSDRLDFWFGLREKALVDYNRKSDNNEKLRKANRDGLTEQESIEIEVKRRFSGKKAGEARGYLDWISGIVQSFGLPAGIRAIDKIKKIPTYEEWNKNIKNGEIERLLKIALESGRGIVKIAFEDFDPAMRRKIKKWKSLQEGNHEKWVVEKAVGDYLRVFRNQLCGKYNNECDGFSYSTVKEKGSILGEYRILRHEIQPKDWDKILKAQEKRRKKRWGKRHGQSGTGIPIRERGGEHVV